MPKPGVAARTSGESFSFRNSVVSVSSNRPKTRIPSAMIPPHPAGGNGRCASAADDMRAAYKAGFKDGATAMIEVMA